MLYTFLGIHLNQIGQLVIAAGIVVLGFIQKRYFDAQSEKAQEIHILVNSQKQDLETRIVELEDEVAALRNPVQQDAPSPPQ